MPKKKTMLIYSLPIDLFFKFAQTSQSFFRCTQLTFKMFKQIVNFKFDILCVIYEQKSRRQVNQQTQKQSSDYIQGTAPCSLQSHLKNKN